MTSLPFVRKDYHRGVEVGVEETEVPGIFARIALTMVERYGMNLCTGTSDAPELMPADQVVSRAVELTKAALSAFRAEGWMVTIPTLNEATKQLYPDAT